MGYRTRRAADDREQPATRPDERAPDPQVPAVDPRTADSVLPRDPLSGDLERAPTPPPSDEEDTTALIFRGPVVPPGMAPPPFAEPHGQQETQTGPSGRTYQFTQDVPTDVLTEDVPYFLAHDTLEFEVAPPRDTPPDDATPRRSAPEPPTAGTRA